MLTLFDRVYTVCLRLYPADYRREYGPLMMQAARDLSRDVLRHNGYAGVLVLWVRILFDAVVTAAATHRDQQEQTVMSSYTFGELTDTGVLRRENQDSMLSQVYPEAEVDDRVGLFVVSDGMGGHQNGDQASKMAVQVISERFGERGEDVSIMDALVDAVQTANTEIHTRLPESGATLVAVAVRNRVAHIVNIGDSRAYVVTEGQLYKLTHDHSMVQRLVDLGQLTPAEAEHHQLNNVLYRALGQADTAAVDMLVYDLPAGSRLLLCSDGLWRMVDEATILDIVTGEANPQEACDKLITLANHRGGQDNVTAIVVTVE
jgi:serine/threonine protein phosphatase PrpC